jgi:hypothetical protein
MKTTRRPAADTATTEADRRFLALRASGYTGPIDQDGRKVTTGPAVAILADLRRKGA